jgi:Gti1/Pac2 family transcription factor
MQSPTCSNLRVRSTRDAHMLFYAVMCRILPIVTRRLDTEERRAVRPGNVYVWEERGPNSEATGVCMRLVTHFCLVF